MSEALFWFIIEVNIKAIVILSLAFALMLCLARFQSQLRYLVWKVVFIILAVLPVLLVVAPNLSFSQFSMPSFTESPLEVTAAPHQFSSPVPPTVQQELLAPKVVERPDERPVAKTAFDNISIQRPMNWPLLFTVIYLVITLLLLLRLGSQFLHCQKQISRFNRNSDIATINKVLTLKNSLGIYTDINLRTNSQVQTPFVWGITRMTLVLPDTFPQWSLPIQDSTLLHELLHIKNRDTVWNLLARLCACLYWPSLLIWKANKNFNLETEKACDENVLKHTNDEEGYADQLVTIAQYIHPMSTSLAILSSSMSRPSTLRQRIDNILTNRSNLVMKSFSRSLVILTLCGLSLFVIAINAVSQANTKSDFKEPEQRPAYVPLVRVEPIYPTRAASQKIEGYVVAEYDISTDGQIANARIVESQPEGMFDDSALMALKQWLYLPAYEDGKAKLTPGVRSKLTFRLGSNANIGIDSFTVSALEQSGPVSVRQANQLIQYYVTANQPVTAIKLLSSFITDNTNNQSQALSLLNNVSFHRFANDDQHAQALQGELALLGAKADLSNSGDVYAAIAKVYQELRNWPKAQLALAKAFEKGQLSDPAATKLTLAVVLFNANRYDAALTVIDSLISTHGTTEQRLTWRGIIDAELYRQNLITDHLVSAALR